VTSDRPSGGEHGDEAPATPPWHSTKYPSTDRMAALPATGKKPQQSFEDALRSFDRTKLGSTVQAAEAERLEVVAKFPLADWPSMPLDGYALGTSNSGDSFCRWMEFATPHIASIKGGSALKHMIFKRKGEEAGWYFEKKYSSTEEAWDHVRAGFVEAFRLAGEGRFDEIGQLSAINSAFSLSTKAVYCYFPNDLLPVCSSSHQDHFWKLLGGVGPVTHGVPAARRLLELVRERPELNGWRPSEIMWFLYDWADPRQSQRIVKIAPGPNAQLWDDCLANSYIRVGWDETGDLREFENRDQFNSKFADQYSALYNGNGPKITQKAGEVWTLTELSPGDIVIANQGTGHIVGIGTVTDRGYEKRDDLGEYTHTVGVAWDPTQARDIDPIKRWAFKTVAPVSQADYLQILRGRTGAQVTTGRPVPVVSVEPLLHEIASELERKGQVILYGPPGTGKTYNARRFAVWWLTERLNLSGAATVLGDPAAFRVSEEGLSHASSDRRVWWVTANPKEWSWDRLFDEESVEYRFGRLRKNYALLREGDLVIGYQANPQKRIMALARIGQTLHATPRGDKITLTPVHSVTDGPTWEELLADERLARSEPIRNRSQGTLFALTPSEGAYLLSWLQERDSNLPDLSEGESEGESGHLTRVTFHPSYTYEDFVEGYKPQSTGSGGLELALEDGVFKRVCRAARLKPDEPFLLLIDEINRGNIPKIFGELITLLEHDKRGLTVTLPQSREKFEVPRNVHVLGTMNTADRSIRLLDAALRRRFAFIELMPDTGPLQGAVVGGLDLALFLEILNGRIAKTEGREKQIGHSFLLDDSGQPLSDIEQFAAQFRHEIVPLLQEYAFEDYTELESYLGKGVVDVDSQRIRPGLLDDAQALVDALVAGFNQAVVHADVDPA
jgi:5-methylcytosine-specific restriction protein B